MSGKRIEVPMNAKASYRRGQAQAIGNALAERPFTSMAQAGHPERGATGPFDGLSVFAPLRLTWMHFALAGSSGERADDGTSAILWKM